MLPLRRTPDAKFLRALWLSQNWAQMRGNQRVEDPAAYAYAKFLAELNQNIGFAEQERYMAMRPVLAAIYWLMSAAPDWQASLMQRRNMSQQPMWPINGHQDTSINVVLQHERSVMKALVLAEATPEFIANQLDYDPKVVRLFEELCWDVRRKSQARAWIHNFVFPEGIQAPIDPSDFERMVLQRAYTHGIDGVMAFLHLNGSVLDPAKHAKQINAMNGADLAAKSSTTIQGLSQRQGPDVVVAAVGLDKVVRELEIKEKAASEKPGGPNANSETNFTSKVIERLAVMGGDFRPADATVPCTLGAEERHDDSKFQEALKAALLEAQLTPQ